MRGEAKFVAPPSAGGVLMVEQEIVRRIRMLAEAGWGSKRISAEVGVARNTVRRYVRGGVNAQTQVRPEARVLTDGQQARAIALWEGPAEGNAAVVRTLLAEQGIKASLRTVQRALAGRRRAELSSQLATVRFETPPGKQMQIDFGEKKVWVAGQLVKVYLLVAVLSYSRRLFVRAFLNQRGDDWREGIAAAFTHFGGVPIEVLGDNAKALVLDRDKQAGTVRFHPTYLSFCRDWDVQPKACGPYRARTKGKTESGVKYVKRNALAGRRFTSFAELGAHLVKWMSEEADLRTHGTTHERPIDRFDRDEKAALRPLPLRRMSARQQRLKRRVAHDALVDVDTVRYSVPHQLVRERVEVVVGDDQVRIYRGAELVATHARSREPHARVVDNEHWKGLWRAPTIEAATPANLPALGRTLDEYAELIERGAA